jgi:CRP/FNR family transcriptional regulator, cyclic AMP receptor protein
VTSQQPRRPIFELDAELEAVVPAEQRERARASVTVATRTLPEGGWNARAEYRDCHAWLGLLVIEGFLARETACAGETVTEIIGRGDLLRPWDHDDEYPIEGITTAWRPLDTVTVALLDEQFAISVAAWPSLTVTILARIARRARWLGLRLLISQVPRLPIRVFYFLWHLAERWGEPDGETLRIPIKLTHEQIAGLIGAQRPSVSTAISGLRDQGVLRIPGYGWQIPRQTPALIERMMRSG